MGGQTGRLALPLGLVGELMLLTVQRLQPGVGVARDRRTSGGCNILDRERFKLNKPEVEYPCCFSTMALIQIEAKLLFASN